MPSSNKYLCEIENKWEYNLRIKNYFIYFVCYIVACFMLNTRLECSQIVTEYNTAEQWLSHIYDIRNSD